MSGTKYQAAHQYSGKLCDLLVFWSRDISHICAFALELKGGDPRVEHAARQIQGGADVINQLLGGADADFLPVLVHAGITTLQVRALGKIKVSFRGKLFPIKLKRCGMRLADLGCSYLGADS